MYFRRMTAILMAMVILATAFLPGCVTRSRRDWGYVDNGTPQTSTAYLPVQPNGTVTLPNGNTVPAQPGAVYPAYPQQTYPQQAYPTYASVGSNKMTYEHNSEEYDLNTVFNGINTAANAFFMGTAGAYMINRMAYPHNYRHHHHRW